MTKQDLTVKIDQKNADPDALRKEVVSVGKHSMIYLVGRALSHAVGFFMIPIYTRFIAPTNYGAMELIEILSATIAMIISMGVADGMSRFYYAERDYTKRDEVVSTIIIGFGLIWTMYDLKLSGSAADSLRTNFNVTEVRLKSAPGYRIIMGLRFGRAFSLEISTTDVRPDFVYRRALGENSYALQHQDARFHDFRVSFGYLIPLMAR